MRRRALACAPGRPLTWLIALALALSGFAPAIAHRPSDGKLTRLLAQAVCASSDGLAAPAGQDGTGQPGSGHHAQGCPLCASGAGAPPPAIEGAGLAAESRRGGGTPALGLRALRTDWIAPQPRAPPARA